MRPLIAPVALIVSLVAACDLDPHEQVVIPDDAQVIHVFADDDTVQLVPAVVERGDVYLVLEGPNPSISLVGASGPDGDLEGMDEAQVERLVEGDFQDTRTDGISVICAPDEWTVEDHWAGCGENVKLTLEPGFYGAMASGDEPGVAPVMAVLEVTP